MVRSRTSREAARSPCARAVLGCCLISLMIVLAGSDPASAHATVVSTSPPAASSVPRSPAALRLSFNENVTIGATPVVLRDSAGRTVQLGAARLSQSASVLTVPVVTRLSGRVYTVTWQVTSPDGDIVGGDYRFGVGPRLTGRLLVGSGLRLSSPGLWPTALLRWLLFVSFAIGFGGIVASRLTRRRPAAPSPPKPWALPAAAVGAVAALGLAALNVGGGDLVRGLSNPSVSELLRGREGILVAVELLAFVAAAISAVLRHPHYAAAPFFVVAICEGLRGHPDALAGGWGALLLTVHMCVAALWVGGLVQTLRTAVAWRTERRLASAVVRDYSRWALWLFLAVVATGLTTTLIVTPITSLLTTAYGRILVAKVALVAVAAAFAFTARRRLSGEPALAPVVTRARVESVVLLAVLAATGLLVSEPPPRTSGDTPAFAPSLTGRSIAVGGRAGHLGVFVQAAQGRLNVTVSTPELANSGADDESGQSQSSQLTGAMQSARGQRQPLAFEGCGTGCFTAPISLPTGLAQLSLHAEADRWTGGVVALTLPWPPRPAPGLLTKVVSAMRRVPSFTLYEQVTSDTSHGLGPTRRIAVAGSAFLSSEPYSQAKAGIVDAYTAPDGTVLNLAYPPDKITVQLTVDATGRIFRETLATPKELVVRTFVYPESR